MKKILSLFLALSLLVMLCACGGDEKPSGNPGENNTQPGSTQSDNPGGGTQSDNPGGNGDDNPGVPSTPGGPTDIDFASDVKDLEGDWKLSKVFVDGETADATAGALTLKITLDVDPYELVDGEAYIHNQLYNLTGILTFGVDSIVSELKADDIDNYKGSASWEDFSMGKVMPDGEWYEQPGPTLMSFKDIDDYGLYLDEIAGIGGDVDTTNKRLIIGMNSDGQLLLGYSDAHIERPGTSGEWEYLLIFDK